MNFTHARFTPESETKPGDGAYVYHDQRIVLAVNVALATRRPLLVTGAPGAGKSTLAADVAQRLGWAYISTTITSRTQIEDLVARFDNVARLNDAQTDNLKEPREYLVPGVLWWAFDPTSAKELPAGDDARVDRDHDGDGVVVLLDEIDKAEPDLPNDLLSPLDTNSIAVPGQQRISSKTDVLVVITSNGERTMPPAFLRRCVTVELDDKDPEFFTRVATSHFGRRDDSLYADIASRTIELGKQAEAGRRRRPSMAEYLDTVRACIRYGERPPNAAGAGSKLWDAIEEAALRKSRAAGAESSGE